MYNGGQQGQQTVIIIIIILIIGLLVIHVRIILCLFLMISSQFIASQHSEYSSFKT